MILFHGSNTGGIKTLEPRLADHDRPYIYMTTLEVVSALYLCNGVDKPYYWFPYGFSNGNIEVPIYHELYPNALKEVSDGVQGFIYKVNASEKQVIPFKNIPCARLGIEALDVVDCLEVDNAHDLLQEYIKQGKLEISYYEDKSLRELENWYGMIYDYIKEKEMDKTPDCSYAAFVQKKFPFIWDRYINAKQLIHKTT